MISFILVVFVGLLHASIQQVEEDDICSYMKHYNSPTVTCCAMKKYKPPGVNFFVTNPELDSCKMDSKIMSSNLLVEKTWLMYKCVVENLAGVNKEDKEELTIDKFTNFMISRFPSDIQELIKKKIEIIQKETEKLVIADTESREKRNVRMRRDNKNGDNEVMATSTSSSKVVDEETSDLLEQISTEAPVDEQESNVAEVEKEAEAKGGTTHAKYISVYDHLSMFDYASDFKNLLPDVNISRVWDMYYVAEFEACQIIANASVNEQYIKSFGADRCYSWIQRTARSGDCCGVAPIPTPLLDEPIIGKETIQNFTAGSLFSITGKYTFTNLSYSSNIDRCRRLAIALLQKKSDLEALKSEIKDYVPMNVTTKPNYEKIVDILVPPFYPTEMVNSMKAEILSKVPKEKETEAKDPQNENNNEGQPEEEEEIYDIDSDISGDIKKISNIHTSMYKWAVVSEWEKLDVDRTRYLMWTCDAYKIISQRIKYFDPTPFCY